MITKDTPESVRRIAEVYESLPPLIDLFWHTPRPEPTRDWSQYEPVVFRFRDRLKNAQQLSDAQRDIRTGDGKILHLLHDSLGELIFIAQDWLDADFNGEVTGIRRKQ